MWRPWSKPVTLAICNTGIALSNHGNKTQLLTDADFAWKEANQLVQALDKNKDLIKNQKVKVILSNALMRYLVLPWQEGILTQADWQAIAQHEFGKQFGAMANDWLVCVSLAKYGQNVLAAAMDNNLYAQLQASATELGFNICAIEPLLTRIFIQHHPNDWALIAEPQRLLLCQIQDGAWQKVVMDSPPAGQEYQHAEQMIQRNFLQLETSNQPSKVHSFVSAALSKIWHDKIDSRQKIMTNISAAEPHSTWLAGLRFIGNKTQKTSLDFSGKMQAKVKFGDFILLLGAFFLATFLWANYQQTQAKIVLLQQQARNSLSMRGSVKSDPALDDKLKFVLQAQQQLNLPWMPMLTALEAVKKANQNVEFTNISPNKNRAEIKLNGEAMTFADITHLLDDLRMNAAFSDAVLVSQHLEQDNEQSSAQIIYVFEINLSWRL